MSFPAELQRWIRPDLIRQLHVRDLIGRTSTRPIPICRGDASLSDVVMTLVDSPGARNVYVIDQNERLLGQVSLSSLSRVLLFDYHPTHLYPRSLVSMITAKFADDIMEPVDVVVRENDSLEEVLHRLIPTGEDVSPVVDDGGHVIGCLSVVDSLGRGVSSDE
jgi:CBS domain-containing protein